MKTIPAGFRVIVKPDPLSEVEEKEMAQFEALRNARFEIADQGDKRRKEGGIHTGTLVAIGITAWKAYDEGEPWAAVGDKVHFAKQAGYVFEEDGTKYRCMNDQDITAVVRADV